jgi:hypothetical protein
MSEGIVVALIGFAGAVLGAAIAGFAAIAAAGTKKRGSNITFLWFTGIICIAWCRWRVGVGRAVWINANTTHYVATTN